MSTPAAHSTTLTVTGMTCGHCADSVREEISEIAGVVSVDVVVETGQVTVHSEAPVGAAELSTAVAEAGYAVV